MMNKNGATVSHLSLLPAHFVQRTVAQFIDITAEAEMASYMKELGYGA
ncbi:hypothetical protein [Endozoicomonas euniceicola]|uniref:Uncharacterized protein n=1 Tax=Endozoicomonas euniceicola TaxID=1234143 RepID=A0ABY6GYH7_9GAMM|nr:hypothetical protein [Endozoicomonas euniceicola]UYM16969.1 hypothetical protein NX720_03325 [Endozoicomonas euniceicola]